MNELRLRVLRALEASPELSQRRLAGELGVSLDGVNYVLEGPCGEGLYQGPKLSEVR